MHGYAVRLYLERRGNVGAADAYVYRAGSVLIDLISTSASDDSLRHC
jgi:hypothetical protein